jgi:hypothetical protein
MADITDTAFPIWTENVNTSNVAGTSTPSGRGRGDSSLASISEILGWRVNKSDPQGIRRALNEAFHITKHNDGTSSVDWKQRGFRVQVGSSGITEVTGAQRSLYERARAMVDQIYPLLDGLMPLTSDPDWEDINAIQSLIRPELEEMVAQFGAEGGPVPQRVDNVLELLIDYDPDIDDTRFADPATVTGQLGLLRTRLDLVSENVNTIDEELRLTNFHTLVNYVDMLRLTWHAQRDSFDRVDAEAFLGTHSVLIERALTCVAESIHEVYRAMDSVFLGPAERATVTIEIGGVRVTLAELLEWIDDIASKRGFDIIRESGKDGIIHALAPTLERLNDLLNSANAFIAGEKLRIEQGAQDILIPRALATNRVTSPMLELQTHLDNARRFSTDIKRADGPDIDEIRNRGNTIEVDSGEMLQLPNINDVRLQIQGNNFRQKALVALVQPGTQPLLPIRTVWRDASRLTAIFDLRNAPDGDWKVRVLNDNGTETVTNAVVNINPPLL